MLIPVSTKNGMQAASIIKAAIGDSAGNLIINKMLRTKDMNYIERSIR